MPSCLQVVDNFQYELPEEFEDEEIDEDMAFTEEDNRLYAHMVGPKRSKHQEASEEGDEDNSGADADLNRDDFSDDVSAAVATQFRGDRSILYSCYDRAPCHRRMQRQTVCTAGPAGGKRLQLPRMQRTIPTSMTFLLRSVTKKPQQKRQGLMARRRVAKPSMRRWSELCRMPWVVASRSRGGGLSCLMRQSPNRSTICLLVRKLSCACMLPARTFLKCTNRICIDPKRS